MVAKVVSKMVVSRNAPSLSVPGPVFGLTLDQGVRRYLADIKKFPMLSAQEEQSLARRWRNDGDVAAAHRLVTSYLRLVPGVARGYKGYGLPFSELIAEGNIGLMQAVRRFDPERGFRLATYAIWWVRAAITDYVLRSWSLVKVGATSARKKLFFNLGKIKKKLGMLEQGDISPAQARRISRDLDVPEQDVVDMNRRLSMRDTSLNEPVGHDQSGEYIDLLPDHKDGPDVVLAERGEHDYRSALLETASSQLNPRERDIIKQRRLRETPRTLEELARHYGVSRERIRQIETRAFEKLRDGVLTAHATNHAQASSAQVSQAQVSQDQAHR